MNLINKDVVSIKDFSNKEIGHVLDVAEKMIPVARGAKKSEMLKGKLLANLFFEPSTRTRLSFETAMKRLGGKVIGFDSSKGTSIEKGENIADTVRVVSGYSDLIVIRHPHEGSARLAAEFSKVPIINAGDGAGKHPTQCLLDLFTIRKEKGAIENQHVGLLGDLKYGRTTHSLASVLARMGAKLTCIAPQELQLPKEIIEECQERGTEPKLMNRLEDEIKNLDVLYVTRIQKERFPDPAEYKRIMSYYRIDKEVLGMGKKDLIVMHPLPRITEIASEVDSLPQAVYFKQAFNGVPVRMALLALILGGIK
ncbi:MAG TPA: aspartate carbamoyltransferase [Thermoplasmata archaeon]|nr:aspartate carbamoyltransferase [Thermoplasmata archaeon]